MYLQVTESTTLKFDGNRAISTERCVSSQKGDHDFGEFLLIALVSLSNFVHVRKAQLYRHQKYSTV